MALASRRIRTTRESDTRGEATSLVVEARELGSILVEEERGVPMVKSPQRLSRDEVRELANVRRRSAPLCQIQENPVGVVVLTKEPAIEREEDSSVEKHSANRASGTETAPDQTASG